MHPTHPKYNISGRKSSPEHPYIKIFGIGPKITELWAIINIRMYYAHIWALGMYPYFDLLCLQYAQNKIFFVEPFLYDK